MKKNILIFFVLSFGIFSFASEGKAADRLSRVTFDESSLVDMLGYVNTLWLYGEGVPTYPSGHTGRSVRTSHNDEDGGGDLIFRLPAGFPPSGEIYVSYWAKYESGYWGNYSGIWNVKIMSAPTGSGPHTELIWQSYDSSSKTMGLEWQMEQGMSWDGNSTVTKYASVPYVIGDWLHVEIYMKKSSGATFQNMDGIAWAKFDGAYAFNDNAIITGDFTRPLDIPSIKATVECLPGEGWWQFDDYEIWNGIPDVDLSPPAMPSSLTVK
ncbi:MAG: hypothetical protein GYA69_06270 [Candidatus Moranbacteria bacterium]|nr:hypothetical protein [Candidatus Moranbacteria bacterium]